MTGKTTIHVICVLTIAALFTSAVWGQANSSLRGAITDQSGAVVPKAQVTLSNSATGLERKTTASDAGSYEFLQVTPGAYRLRVEATGFKKYEANDLQLEVNNPATVNIVLEDGGSRGGGSHCRGSHAQHGGCIRWFRHQ